MIVPSAGSGRHLRNSSFGLEAMRAAAAARLLKQSLATESRCHWSISMVREPTKTLRGALAFFRGASCSIKTRDPLKQDRMIDFAIARRIVNAANKNKRFSFERRRLWRMNSPRAARVRKECFCSSFRRRTHLRGPRNGGSASIAGVLLLH